MPAQQVILSLKGIMSMMLNVYDMDILRLTTTNLGKITSLRLR